MSANKISQQTSDVRRAEIVRLCRQIKSVNFLHNDQRILLIVYSGR